MTKAAEQKRSLLEKLEACKTTDELGEFISGFYSDVSTGKISGAEGGAVMRGR
jgi:hypothetical protein